jgi:hypothetical protein
MKLNSALSTVNGDFNSRNRDVTGAKHLSIRENVIFLTLWVGTLPGDEP